jgi:hypothetical protein
VVVAIVMVINDEVGGAVGRRREKISPHEEKYRLLAFVMKNRRRHIRAAHSLVFIGVTAVAEVRHEAIRPCG